MAAAFRTEELYYSVLHVTGTPTDPPVHGLWTFVPTLDYVYAEISDGPVEYVSLDDVKKILQTRQKNYIPVVLGRCDDTVLWGYITRRYAHPCGVVEHKCADNYVITVQNFLPAVLNSSNVHVYDTAPILKTDVDDFKKFKLFAAHMSICDHVIRSNVSHVTGQSVFATPITWAPIALSRDDIRSPVLYNMVAHEQIMDALRPIQMPMVHVCAQPSMELSADLSLYETVGMTPVSADAFDMDNDKPMDLGELDWCLSLAQQQLPDLPELPDLPDLPDLPNQVLPDLPDQVLPDLPNQVLPDQVLPDLPLSALPTKIALPRLPFVQLKQVPVIHSPPPEIYDFHTAEAESLLLEASIPESSVPESSVPESSAAHKNFFDRRRRGWAKRLFLRQYKLW